MAFHALPAEVQLDRRKQKKELFRWGKVPVPQSGRCVSPGVGMLGRWGCECPYCGALKVATNKTFIYLSYKRIIWYQYSAVNFPHDDKFIFNI